MPYVSEKIKLSETQDRRIKLTTEQKEEIRSLYETGMYSHRTLAKQFGCSKSRIGQIVNPEREAKVKTRIKEHWKDYRPSKEKWNEIVRDHRHYKQELYLKGELQGESNRN